MSKIFLLEGQQAFMTDPNTTYSQNWTQRYAFVLQTHKQQTNKQTKKRSVTSSCIPWSLINGHDPLWTHLTLHGEGVVLWFADKVIKRGGLGAVLWGAVRRHLDVFTDRASLGLWKHCALFPLLQPTLPSSSHSHIPLSTLRVYCAPRGVDWNTPQHFWL